MSTETLTEARVRSAKAPGEGILELWDTRSVGLCLRIMASGIRSWSFRYRPKAGLGFRRVTFGQFPAMSLADARGRADQLRLAVRSGADPQHDIWMTIAARRDEEERQALTFDQLAAAYLERYAKRQKSSWRNDEGYLRRHVQPVWGPRAAATITKQDAGRLLGEIKDKTPTGANRTRSVLSKVFTWAVDESLLATNPMLGVKKPHKENKGKDRVLTDDELRVLWTAIEAARLADGTEAALQVLALLGQRPGEVAGMHRAELIHLDRPADARWEIPAERMKARRSHVVPLPPLAREIILRQLASNDHRGEGFVFASRFADKQRLARHSLSQAVKRVIAALSPGGSDGATIRALRAKPPTPHDFRRTLATRLAEFGIPREDRLAILAHSWGDVHGSHYDRYERLREKRVALEAWDRHVAELLGLRRQAVLICERQQVRAAG